MKQGQKPEPTKAAAAQEDGAICVVYVEVTAANPLAELDAKWGNNPRFSGAFLINAYLSIAAHS